jgi:hypothetical protein
MLQSLARLHIHLFKNTGLRLMSGLRGIDRWIYDGSTAPPRWIAPSGRAFFLFTLTQGDALGYLSLPRWGVEG